MVVAVDDEIEHPEFVNKGFETCDGLIVEISVTPSLSIQINVFRPSYLSSPKCQLIANCTGWNNRGCLTKPTCLNHCSRIILAKSKGFSRGLISVRTGHFVNILAFLKSRRLTFCQVWCSSAHSVAIFNNAFRHRRIFLPE